MMNYDSILFTFIEYKMTEIECISLNRNPSVKSTTPFPSISNQGFDNNLTLCDQHERNLLRFAMFLRKTSIFSDLPYNELIRISTIFKEIKLRKNQVLYKENTKADFLYIIKSGEFKLSKTSQLSPIQATKVTSLKSSKSIFHLKFSGGPPPKTKEFQIVIKSENEALAAEELLSKLENYQQTCTCISNESEILVASVSDFRLKARHSDIWKKLSKLVDMSKPHYDNRFKVLKNVEELKENRSQSFNWNQSEGFRKNQGLLRKLSPARDMVNSHYVSVEDRRKAQKESKIWKARTDFPALASSCLKNINLSKRIFAANCN